MSASLVFALLLPFLLGLTYTQRRKWALGPATGLKVFFGGRLIPTDMAEFTVGTANIAAGDALYLSSNKVYPAASQADQGTLAANQELFHDGFAGFALEAASANQTALIPVATAGIMDLDCASATFEVGDLIGLSENAGGTALLNTTGISVSTDANYAVGRSAEKIAVAALRVRVNFISTIVYGGPQNKM